MSKKKFKNKRIIAEPPDKEINTYQEIPAPADSDELIHNEQHPIKKHKTEKFEHKKSMFGLKISKLSKKFNLDLISIINLIIYSMFFIMSLLYIDGLTYASEEPRWWVFTIAAALLPLLASIHIFLKKNVIKINITWFHIIIFAIFLWISLSLIWSIDRAEIVTEYIYNISWILLAVFFSFYARKLNISTVFRLFPFAVSAVSFIGILQYFSLDGNIFDQVAAPASTFANKNMATPMAALLLPSIYYMILFVESEKWARIYTACFSLSLTYLVVAATRSSWVGAFFSLIFTIIGMIMFKAVLRTFKSAFIKRRILYLLLGVFLTVFTIIIHETGDFPDVGISGFAQFNSLTGEGITQGSGNQRLMFWQNTLAMIADRPLHGVGLASYDSAYPLYHNSMVNDTSYAPDYYVLQAHNDPLQCLAELGFIGFTLFLLMFLLIFYQLIRLLLNDNSKMLPYYLAFATGITGLLIDSLFNFPFQFSTHMFFFILMAGIVQSKFTDTFEEKLKVYSINFNYKIVTAAIAPVFFILFIFSLYIAFYRYLGDQYDYQARTYYQVKDYKKASAYAAASVEAWPYKFFYIFRGAIYSFQNLLNDTTEENYQSAIKYVNMALKSSPYQYNLNLVLFNLVLMERNPIILSQIKKKIPLFIKVTPDEKIFQTYELIANIYYYSNDIENSIKYYEKVLENHPDRKDIIMRVKSLK